MKKIIIYGSFLEYNLGLPSLLHGIEELIYNIYGEDTQCIYYEYDKLGGRITDSYKSQIKYIPFQNGKHMLKSALRYKFLKKGKETEKSFFKEIESADVVVDLYGIYFCSNIEKNKMGRLKAVYSSITNLTIPFIAKKLFGVKTVKTAASYGPLETKGLDVKAQYTINSIFDVVCARERQSKQVICDNCSIKKDIIVTPDVANLMKYEAVEYGESKRIGIVVSHQIDRQWKSNESYRQCMASLINHINSNLPEYKVIIIPNETSPLKKNNDIDMAKSILGHVSDAKKIEVFDDIDINACEMKTLIASCDVVVSARYHSCVAALSSGIPLLAMGWHNKYDELLQLYNQNQNIISGEDCTSEKLINKFDSIWKNREQIRDELKNAYTQVESDLHCAYKKVFMIGEK